MADDIEALVRRFEPILIFAELERFFPSDAKRYFERCALWSSDLPLDEKDSWGGKGNPFPARRSLITTRSLPRMRPAKSCPAQPSWAMSSPLRKNSFSIWADGKAVPL